MDYFAKRREHQRRTGEHIKAHPFAAVLLDMGMGKTVETLTQIWDLLCACLVTRVLVVAPLRVCINVWPREVSKWDHLRNLRVSVITGEPHERLAALCADADVHCINYENLIWLFRQLGDPKKLAKLPWDMFVFDESSKMKSHAAKRFKLFKLYLHFFCRGVILTGTPSANSYLDLWAQYFLLDRGERLGSQFTKYQAQYFTPFGPYNRQVWKIRPRCDQLIDQKVTDLTLCLQAEDHIDLPPMIYNDITLELPDEVRALYKTFEADLFAELDGRAIEAFDESGVSGRCRELTSGSVYAVDPLTMKRTGEVNHFHTVKLDALEDIIDDAQGSPVLVVYEFRHELDRLRERWPKAPWIGGGQRDAVATAAIDAWNRGEVPVLIVHPGSVAYGLNLQDGGHIIVWTSSTWNLEYYQQLNRRLQREGQKFPVMVHHLRMRRTVDMLVKARLSDKGGKQSAFMAALRDYQDGVRHRV